MMSAPAAPTLAVCAPVIPLYTGLSDPPVNGWPGDATAELTTWYRNVGQDGHYWKLPSTPRD